MLQSASSQARRTASLVYVNVRSLVKTSPVSVEGARQPHFTPFYHHVQSLPPMKVRTFEFWYCGFEGWKIGSRISFNRLKEKPQLLDLILTLGLARCVSQYLCLNVTNRKITPSHSRATYCSKHILYSRSKREKLVSLPCIQYWKTGAIVETSGRPQLKLSFFINSLPLR